MTSEIGSIGSKRRSALCLCGGGITGAMYQVGCLAALEDGVTGFRANDFDLFVGSSSGATVATCFAGGLQAQRMYRALLDPADVLFAFHRSHLLQFDLGEWRRVGRTALSAARKLVSSLASRHPLEYDPWNVWLELDRFYDSLPAGIFTLDAYEQFFAEFMARRGISEDFGALPRDLLIVAHDLDSGERVAFGRGLHPAVRVSRAVAASSASPILFAPVRIDDRDYVDGGIGELAHIDLAVRAGCDLVVVVNPMVPIRSDPLARDIPTGHGRMLHVRDKGLLWVHNQAWRIRTEDRFRRGLERFRAEHPEVVVVLLEPDQGDATMFMYSPMNFAARRTILEHGYTSTTRLLRAPDSPIRAALSRSIRAVAPI